MECKDIIKKINVYKLDNKTGNIQLNINEYNYTHNLNVINKLKDYINEENIIQYSSLNSSYQTELIDKISSYTKVNKYQLLLMNGGDIIINNILKTYASENSNIIIFEPTYSQYERISSTITENIININTIDDFNLIDKKILNQKNNNKRTICFICNPNNPTGNEWNKSDLNILFKKYPNVLFVIDETYIDFSILADNYQNIYSCTECLDIYDNIIIMRSFSKAFGLAGLRISYIASNINNINNISSITSHKDITELSKLAALHIINNIDFYKIQINKLMNDKKIITNFCDLNNITYIDTKCNFLLINCGNNVDIITNCFLEKKISVKNLNNIYTYSANMLNNYIRISLHSEYISNIIDILSQYKKNINN